MAMTKIKLKYSILYYSIKGLLTIALLFIIRNNIKITISERSEIRINYSYNSINKQEYQALCNI